MDTDSHAACAIETFLKVRPGEIFSLDEIAAGIRRTPAHTAPALDEMVADAVVDLVRRPATATRGEHPRRAYYRWSEAAYNQRATTMSA